jgi:hypothetical protein
MASTSLEHMVAAAEGNVLRSVEIPSIIWIIENGIPVGVSTMASTLLERMIEYAEIPLSLDPK